MFNKLVVVIILGLVAYVGYNYMPMYRSSLATLLAPGDTTRDYSTPPSAFILPEGDLSVWKVPGRHTIVVFTANWCPGCRALDGKLYSLLSRRSDVVVRKVSLDNRSNFGRYTELTGQNIKSIPHVVIYSADGKLLAQDDGAIKPGLDLLEEWLNAEQERAGGK